MTVRQEKRWRASGMGHIDGLPSRGWHCDWVRFRMDAIRDQSRVRTAFHVWLSDAKAIGYDVANPRLVERIDVQVTSTWVRHDSETTGEYTP
jgi:hypothetical protein